MSFVGNDANGQLAKKALHGGFWVFAIQISNRGLLMIKILILARLLSPDDFGLMGIALLALSIVDVFTQTGIEKKLVQHKEDIQDFINTAWTILFVRGILISAAIFILAEPIAIFFDNTDATPIIRIIGLSQLLVGATNIGIVYFQRNLQFKKQFIYEVGGTVADFAISIVAVLIFHSVVALISGFIAGAFVKLIISFIIVPIKPKLSFNKEKSKEMRKFGKWITGSSILVFATTQADSIIVGKLLGTASLGLYQMAGKIANMIAPEVAYTVSRVTYPIYSQLQDNVERLHSAFLKTLKITTLITIFLCCAIFSIAEEGTYIFLGTKWMDIVPVVRVLALAGIMRALIGVLGNVFNAVGKPYLDTKWQLVRLIVLAIIIYPLSTKWGILGTSWAMLISIGCITPAYFIKPAKLTNCTFRQIAILIGCPAIAGFVMIASVLTVRPFLETNIFGLATLSAIAIVSYLLVLILLNRIYNLKETIVYIANLLRRGRTDTDSVSSNAGQ